MAAGLDPLGDHRVDTRLRRRLGLLDGPDLDEHLHPGLVRGFDVRFGVAPEEHRCGGRRAGRGGDHRTRVGGEALLVGLGDDEVEPERPVGQRPGPLGLGPDVARVIPTRAEDPEPARVRDRAHELGPGAPSEPDRKDRVLDAEQVAERRANLRGGVTLAHNDITLSNVLGPRGGDQRQRLSSSGAAHVCFSDGSLSLST